MKCYFCLLLLYSCQVVVGQEQVTCLGGGFGSNKKKQVTIPPQRINDGYCDCPLDGLDEPNTEACSGSSGWTGITIPANNNNVER